MKKFTLTICLACALILPLSAQAEDTNISISARAKDALFIGEAVGGAFIIVRDKRDGDILVEGRTKGGGGDQAKIMADTKRDSVWRDDKSAHFEFSLDLFEPTPVSIEVSGPYGQTQSLVKASADYLLIPGKDYTQDNGIIIELPGFIVDVLNPAINHTAKFNPEGTWPLQANVTKLSGDPIAKDTPWSPERYAVEAHIYRGDLFLAKVAMETTAQPGIYATNMKFQEAGTYRIVVTAFDSKTLEGGTDATTITLEP